jgi:sec-independent protein translocase protein TatA
VIIGLIVVLLVGAKKLPELARSVGKASSEFKKGVKEGSTEDRPVEPSETPAPGDRPAPEA